MAIASDSLRSTRSPWSNCTRPRSVSVITRFRAGFFYYYYLFVLFSFHCLLSNCQWSSKHFSIERFIDLVRTRTLRSSIFAEHNAVPIQFDGYMPYTMVARLPEHRKNSWPYFTTRDIPEFPLTIRAQTSLPFPMNRSVSGMVSVGTYAVVEKCWRQLVKWENNELSWVSISYWRFRVFFSLHCLATGCFLLFRGAVPESPWLHGFYCESCFSRLRSFSALRGAHFLRDIDK